MPTDAFWHGFVSSDWNTGLQPDGSSNWGTAPPGASGATPVGVPITVANFPINALSFDVTFSENTLIATLLFQPGAPVYTFDLAAHTLTIIGLGIINPIGSNSPVFELPPAGLAPLPVLTFNNQSTAGNAIIRGQFAIGTAGKLLFLDSSTAGTATIIRIEALFGNSSNAGTATINNILAGKTVFSDHSSAKFATITNSGFGVTQFFGLSTADHVTINNFDQGVTVFDSDENGSSTASQATIKNIGGRTLFQDGGTAGNATITNLPSQNPANTVTGITEFLRSDAGTATIVNDGGLTVFADGSTAEKAMIINNKDGITQFEDDGDAAQATITTNNGGFTKFLDRSTAGQSTITTKDGGRLIFVDEVRGEQQDSLPTLVASLISPD